MLFSFSKLAWSIVAPGNALVFALILGLVLCKRKTNWLRVCGQRITALIALCFLALTLLPLGQWALTPLENRFPREIPDHVDGIIMLGGDEQAYVSDARQIPVALDSMRRIVTFVDMAKKFPDATLLYSGGSAFPHHLFKTTEADVARELMQEAGLSTDRVLFEKESRNTFENAVFSAEMVKPTPVQNWLLVTSAWHMTRAMACYEHAGFHVFAVPTGYFTPGTLSKRLSLNFVDQLSLLSMAVHEYAGLLAYWLLGRTQALWPS